MRHIRPYFLSCILLLFSACNLSAEQTIPTLTPTNTVAPTSTTIPTMTESPTDIPTATMSPTSTQTATITSTPQPTLTPSITPTITSTPFATDTVTYDNFQSVDIPDSIADGLDTPLIAFLVRNEGETITNLSTALPTNNVETLYFTSPTSRNSRFPVFEINGTTDGQIFLAPRGNALAYFLNDEGNTSTTGLYIVDITFGISQRILAIPSLIQRGIFSPPDWSPDGTLIAVTRETGYQLDIFTYNITSQAWQNLTDHGANDLWAQWSPDGRKIAFVSDRAVCPTWIPAQPNACNPDTDSFTGGHIYLLDLASGTVEQLSDQWTNEPPRWINNRQIAFTVTDQQPDFLNPTSTLWLADSITRQAQQVQIANDRGSTLYISDSWTDTADRVIFQSATNNTNSTFITDDEGDIIASIDEFPFVRFGMVADWSPDGTRLVIGGTSGQCPYGILVFDGQTYETVARGNRPSMCTPVFSPDGNHIAFTGIDPSNADGREDIYSSNQNGFDAFNLTVDLRGEMSLIGWVQP